MPSPEEAAERAVFDDGSSVDDDESDDTDSDQTAPASETTIPNPSPAPLLPNPNPSPVAVAATLQPQNGGSGGGAVVVREPLVYEGAPRLFQKLWTDEDELVILQGFYEFTSQRGTTHADYQYDTGPFYDQIRARLQLDFTKNQLIEKLRRLKKKYRTAVSRIGQGRTAVFKSPHDKATFDISRKIWSPVFKRSRDRDPAADLDPAGPAATRSARRRRLSRGDSTPAPTNAFVPPTLPSQSALAMTPVPVQVEVEGPPAAATRAADVAPPVPAAAAAIEEAVKSCLSPLFRELIRSAAGGGGVGSVAAGLVTPLGFGGGGGAAGNNLAATDEKWRRQQILELEVYAKRLELVQEEIKAKLGELRSAGS